MAKKDKPMNEIFGAGDLIPVPTKAAHIVDDFGDVDPDWNGIKVALKGYVPGYALAYWQHKLLGMRTMDNEEAGSQFNEIMQEFGNSGFILDWNISEDGKKLSVDGEGFSYLPTSIQLHIINEWVQYAAGSITVPLASQSLIGEDETPILNGAAPSR